MPLFLLMPGDEQGLDFLPVAENHEMIPPRMMWWISCREMGKTGSLSPWIWTRSKWRAGQWKEGESFF
jgi:hypothetical protein